MRRRPTFRGICGDNGGCESDAAESHTLSHGAIDVPLELNDGEVALVVVGARAEAAIKAFAVPLLAALHEP